MPKKEDFRVIAVVKFNSGEALVLNRPIEFVYDLDPKDGKSFIGVDGPFRDFLGYGKGGGMKGFAGRELTLNMVDGSVKKVKDDWWQSWRQGYIDITVKDLKGLQECYVFYGASITPEDYDVLRKAYVGTVYPYWDYEKIIKYDSEVKKWIEKYFDEQKKLRTRDKRDALITNLLVGRSTLLHAIKHLHAYTRIMDLTCTIGLIYGEDEDHIGKWKAAGKEYGYGHCDNEEFEMNECPLCSAQYAAYKSKKLLKNRIGRINGILTRMGNKIRERNLEQAFVAGERAEFDRLDKKARQNPPWPLMNKHTEQESIDWQPPFAQEADSL
jgi:hypothetical protein